MNIDSTVPTRTTQWTIRIIKKETTKLSSDSFPIKGCEEVKEGGIIRRLRVDNLRVGGVLRKLAVGISSWQLRH